MSKNHHSTPDFWTFLCHHGTTHSEYIKIVPHGFSKYNIGSSDYGIFIFLLIQKMYATI